MASTPPTMRFRSGCPRSAGTVGQLAPTASGLDALGSFGHVVALLFLGFCPAFFFAGMEQA